MEELGRMYGIQVPKTIIEINGTERVGVAVQAPKGRPEGASDERINF